MISTVIWLHKYSRKSSASVALFWGGEPSFDVEDLSEGTIWRYFIGESIEGMEMTEGGVIDGGVPNLKPTFWAPTLSNVPQIRRLEAGADWRPNRAIDRMIWSIAASSERFSDIPRTLYEIYIVVKYLKSRKTFAEFLLNSWSS